MGKRAEAAAKTGSNAATALALKAEAMQGEVIREIPLELIDDNPQQPRSTMDKAGLKDLASSIQSEGVKQPIVVRKVADSDRYQAAFGHRRCEASRLAGIEKIPAIVREYSDDDMLLVALTENEQREDMSTIDTLKAAAKLVDAIGQKTAAERLGRSKQWLSKATGICNAPEVIQSFVEAGYTTDVEGLYQLVQLHKKQPEQAERLIDDWHREPEIRADLRGQVKDLKPRKTLSDHVEPDEKTKAEQSSGVEYEPDDNSGFGMGEDGADGFELEAETNGEPAEKPSSEHKATPKKVTPDAPPLLSDASYEDGQLILITDKGVVTYDCTEDALERLYSAIKA